MARGDRGWTRLEQPWRFGLSLQTRPFPSPEWTWQASGTAVRTCLPGEREAAPSAPAVPGVRPRARPEESWLAEVVRLQEGLGDLGRRLLVDRDRLVHRDHGRERQLRRDGVHRLAELRAERLGQLRAHLRHDGLRPLAEDLLR